MGLFYVCLFGVYNWMINGGLFIRLDVIRLRISVGEDEINGFVIFYSGFLWLGWLPMRLQLPPFILL